jgi:hypothetical protein
MLDTPGVDSRPGEGTITGFERLSTQVGKAGLPVNDLPAIGYRDAGIIDM